MSLLLWGVIVLCLLAACVMDCRTCEVYNITWWISGAAALLLAGSRRPDGEQILSLALFLLLQLLVFSRIYGRADCYAFCVCAVAETAAGFGFRDFLLHMLAAFGILAIVQAFRRNIGRGGNLKQPVPFLPYITVSFGLLLLSGGFCSVR